LPTADVTTIPVRTVGPVARRLLRTAGAGRVLAVFRTAFYVETGDGLLCVGAAAMEPGPINLLAGAPERADWRLAGIALRARVDLSPAEIRAGRIRFELRDAADWRPDPLGGAVDPAALARGLACLCDSVPAARAAGGLGPFIDPDHRPGPDDPVGRAAAEPIAVARGWLVDGISDRPGNGQKDSHWATRLLGLGPGVTPSGDDFLGGMMIALDCLGERILRDRLWATIAPVAPAATNAISLALLRTASEGLGSASLHRAIAGIVRGDAGAIAAALALLGRIGHSSGWDAMAGAALALRAWQESAAGYAAA